MNHRPAKLKQSDYPDETIGSEPAAEARKKANALASLGVKERRKMTMPCDSKWRVAPSVAKRLECAAFRRFRARSAGGPEKAPGGGDLQPLRALGLRLLCCALLLPPLAFAAALPSVPAPRESVTNTYHGVAVVDDYQWLEAAGAPAVREWTRRQNERTREYLAQLPYREGLAQQLMQLRGEESARCS